MVFELLNRWFLSAPVFMHRGEGRDAFCSSMPRAVAFPAAMRPLAESCYMLW
jgi:hypothetical protein